MMDMIGFFAAALVVGLLVGILSGLLGVGGGTIMVPVFRLGFGLSAVVATATSLFAIIPTSISGMVGHLRDKTCIPKLGLAMGLAGACTSTLGVRLADISPSWLVMLVAALIIAYSAINVFRKAFAAKKQESAVSAKAISDKRAGEASAAATGSGAADAAINGVAAIGAGDADAVATAAGAPTGAANATATANTRPNLSAKDLLFGAMIGLIAGLASGYVGVGGGFIMVPMMLGILNIPMRYASGTSLIAIMILAVPGVVAQIMLGHVDFVVGIAISAGTIPGALIGARLVNYIPERTLRFIFGGMLLVAAVMLVVNELGLIG